jgi:hypothetical protein
MHGSFINRMMERSEQPALVVGMGVTETRWTDRRAYTLIEVLSDKRVVVQEDKARRTDNNGMSESQTYEYTPDPNGTKRVLTLRKDGAWREVGSKKSGASGWLFGVRRAYHDYSF